MEQTQTGNAELIESIIGSLGKLATLSNGREALTVLDGVAMRMARGQTFVAAQMLKQYADDSIRLTTGKRGDMI